MAQVMLQTYQKQTNKQEQNITETTHNTSS